MMRDDFAILILSHGRANNLVTIETLKRQKYSGKWYILIDDEDDQEPDYRRNFGNEHVVKFCKQDVINESDTMDNFGEHKAILFARNASFEIAQKLGLSHFLMLDDDYTSILYRFAEDDRVKLNYKWRMLDDFDGSCPAHWSQIAIDERGNVMYCCHKPFQTVGNILDSDILEKLHAAPYVASTCDVPCRLSGPNHFMREVQRERKDVAFI